MADMIDSGAARPVATYQIGDLTAEYVFKRNGIENVADLQRVFDAMEYALELKNKHYRDVVAEKDAEIERARYEDRP